MSGVQVTTLPNGLRVATDPMPHVETVTTGVWFGVGSRHEPEEANGVAHLVEHMLFKGTPSRDALRISTEIEAVGGHMNAHTGREHTAYYAKVLKEDLGTALDVLSDMVQHPLFDPAELDRERQVIIQEIGQAEDTPDDIINDHFLSTCFPRQRLGRSTLGTVEVISAVQRQTLVDYVGRNYRPGSMVLTAAGNVEHERVVELAERLFTDLQPGAGESGEPGTYEGGEFREERDLEQLHLLLGFQGVGSLSPDVHTVSVLSTILGGGMSSRLFQEVREKRGLVYAVESFNWSMVDSGIFGIYAGTDPDRAEELVPVICGEVGRLADTLTEEEVARARAQLKASQLMSLESTTNRAEQVGTQLLVFGRTIPPAEIAARIDGVSLEAVRRCARTIFGSRPTLAAIGPTGRLEPYDALCRRLSS